MKQVFVCGTKPATAPLSRSCSVIFLSDSHRLPPVLREAEVGFDLLPLRVGAGRSRARDGRARAVALEQRADGPVAGAARKAAHQLDSRSRLGDELLGAHGLLVPGFARSFEAAAHRSNLSRFRVRGK